MTQPRPTRPTQRIAAGARRGAFGEDGLNPGSRKARRRSARRFGTGFTLIEMLIVVAMCALLASIAMPLSEIAATRAKEAELRHALREIRGAIDRYKAAVDTGNITRRADESGYPPSLLVLVEGVVDATDPQRRKLVFLRRVPRDPFAPNDGSPAHASWGLRSYLSDAQEPREGSDVFDVYSRSERVGLNSMPYRQW